MTTADLVRVVDEERREWESFESLRQAYVRHEDVRRISKDIGRMVLVFVMAHELAHHLLDLAGGRIARRGRVLLLEEPEQHLREALRAVFETVVAPPVVLLPVRELAEVLASANRADLCVGGIVDTASGVVVLYRGDLSSLTVPLTAFPPCGDRTAPDPHRFAVTDHGQTLVFGDYEAAFDAVLYEWDPEYRRRLKAQRLADDQSFGASLRRLRNQRGLTRRDFPGVDPRTVARIETGEVDKPHAETLAILAERLGVKPGEIEEF
jgi:hypothetical protein